jgi:hypothetical protein
MERLGSIVTADPDHGGKGVPDKSVIYLADTAEMPVVLYECETWSLTVREEHKLSVKHGL